MNAPTRPVVRGQPDDPGIRLAHHNGVCPTCGCRCARDPDEVVRRLLKNNAGRVHKYVIADALNISVDKVEKLARKFGFDLSLKEQEPRGA